MAIVILFGVKSQPTRIRGRFLYCPKCRQRTRGEMWCDERRLYLLGFIPLYRMEESPNYLRCLECGGKFDENDDFPYDFGEHEESEPWECWHCKEKNPNYTYHCRRCGRHV